MVLHDCAETGTTHIMELTKPLVVARCSQILSSYSVMSTTEALGEPSDGSTSDWHWGGWAGGADWATAAKAGAGRLGRCTELGTELCWADGGDSTCAGDNDWASVAAGLSAPSLFHPSEASALLRGPL